GSASGAGPTHGLSIHGDLKYGPGFTHFTYANPRAPRGGNVTMAATGTFDNLNPFILKGVPAAGIATTFDTLTVYSPAEPTGGNRERPVSQGQLPVRPKAYWAGRDFARTTLDAPLGSGPYRVESLEPGRSITYRRVADYWAAALPVNVGRFNFDTIRFDYYRD